MLYIVLSHHAGVPRGSTPRTCTCICHAQLSLVRHFCIAIILCLDSKNALQVKPILARLKTTLAGSAAALILSAGLLVGFVQAGTDSDGIYGEICSPAPCSQHQGQFVNTNMLVLCCELSMCMQYTLSTCLRMYIVLATAVCIYSYSIVHVMTLGHAPV